MRALIIAVVVVGALLWWTAPPPPLPRADFVLGNGGEPRSLDPAMATALLEGRIARALFEPLVALEGPEAAPVPAAAASWTVHEGGARFVFQLREHGRWSDGAPVEARQFVDGYLRVLHPDVGSRSASYLFGVKGARAYRDAALADRAVDPATVGLRALGERTLEIVLDRPEPSFLSTLSAASLAPIRLDAIAAHPTQWTHAGKLVSNGPFRLAYRAVRERVRLERNPHYWDAENTGFETFDVLALEDRNTLVNLYFTGHVDWLADVPTALLRPIREKHAEHLRLAPLYGTYFIRLNTRIKPLGNRKVRAALDLALDKAALVDALLAGGERPARSLVPPLSGEPPPALRDLEGARRLMAEGLAEEGLKTTPAFELASNSAALHVAMTEAVQRQWREAFGVSVGLGRMEQQAFLAAVERGDYAAARGSWIGDYADPLTFLDVFTSGDPNNQTGFAHARFDELVLRLIRSETDVSRRAALVAEAVAILDAEVPAIPIYYYSSINLIRPEIKGFENNPLDIHLPQRLRR